MRLGFLGAAGEVTGSCTLVKTEGLRFLVDCGMFQGGAEARGKNQRALNLGFDVRQIDFVLLTHAHIDHSGLLPDSAHIQEKEAEWLLRNRRRGKGQGPPRLVRGASRAPR